MNMIEYSGANVHHATPSPRHSVPRCPSTPSDSTPYIPQHNLFINGEYHRIGNPNERMSLMTAIKVARRLMLCPLGIELISKSLTVTETMTPIGESLPVHLRPRDIVADPKIVREVQQWAETGRMFLVADKTLQGYGLVHPDHPTRILIRRDLITHLGNAWRGRFEDDKGMGLMLLFVAIVTMHEMMHVIRYSGIGSQKRTPPRIGDTTRNRVDKSNGVITGEGGWWIEHNLLGGEVIGVTYGANEIPEPSAALKKLVLQVRHPTPAWPDLQPHQITRVVRGDPGWQNLLPFKIGKHNLHPGENTDPVIGKDAAASVRGGFDSGINSPDGVNQRMRPLPTVRPKRCGLEGVMTENFFASVGEKI